MCHVDSRTSYVYIYAQLQLTVRQLSGSAPVAHSVLPASGDVMAPTSVLTILMRTTAVRYCLVSVALFVPNE